MVDFAPNLGRYHPNVAYVAAISESPLIERYRGAGKGFALVDIGGKLIDISYGDIKPIEVEPAKARWVPVMMSATEVVVNHGTAGAALLGLVG